MSGCLSFPSLSCKNGFGLIPQWRKAASPLLISQIPGTLCTCPWCAGMTLLSPTQYYRIQESRRHADSITTACQWPRSVAYSPCMLPRASKHSMKHMHQGPAAVCAVKTLLAFVCSDWEEPIHSSYIRLWEGTSSVPLLTGCADVES